jgi:hypothetical protein
MLYGNKTSSKPVFARAKNHISVPPPDENNIMQQFAKQNTGHSLILTASQ